MTVDGQESPSVTVVGNATTLDVERKLYLGGLPSHYRARNIGTVSRGLWVGGGPLCSSALVPLPQSTWGEAQQICMCTLVREAL